jgi:hypothetical protein
VNDQQNTADVLAMWATWRFFGAEASAWGFDGNLKLPSRTNEHNNVLEMAREAFHAAAALPNEWFRGIALLTVHCEIVEVMSTADATAILIPVRGFLQAGQWTKKQVENVAADLGLAPTARRIMWQQRV